MKVARHSGNELKTYVRETLSSPVESSPPQEFKILVADDSPIYRKLVEYALSDQPYTVLFAKNGRQAVDLFAQHQPNLVVTDWVMPDLTGIELCQHIRGQGQTVYTYVIMLTSMSDKDKIVSGLAAGADDYLTKPLALADSLTGLPNRRALEAWAARQLDGAARHGFSFWVVMADLDNFKSVNDTYGHAAGDLVLKQFAEILRVNTRKSNLCARIGGEEFLLVLTHAEKEHVRIAISRVREQLEAHKFEFGTRTLNVTASFGVSGWQGVRAPDFELLVSQADSALGGVAHDRSATKRNGRNRIEFASL